MSKTLTMIHAGWASIESLARQGRRQDALHRITGLLTRPDLPATLAAEAHRLAGELLLDAERYAKARRHLRAAAGHEPTHARTHYLLGLAFENDPEGDDRHAAIRFREASKLMPENALYRACFGRAAVRCDKLKTGVREMLAAADAAPENVQVVRVVVGGLIEAGRVKAARRVLVKARFLNPRHPELTSLWNRVRFEAARMTQKNTPKTQDAMLAMEGDVALLPFVRLVGSTAGKTPVSGTIRRDLMSRPRPHLARLRARKADR